MLKYRRYSNPVNSNIKKRSMVIRHAQELANLQQTYLPKPLTEDDIECHFRNAVHIVTKAYEMFPPRRVTKK